MKLTDMFQRGAAHRHAGHELTPFACRAIDAELLQASKYQPRPAKWYSRMRGAFNRGWEHEHARMVSNS